MTALAYHNSQPESRDFWKHELTQAVTEIRQVYDDKLEAMRGQLESNYTVKVTKPWCPVSNVDRVIVLPERDYVTFGSLLSQIRLSSVCLSFVCL